MWKQSSLRKHFNAKHGKVKCLECGKEFKSLYELKMHQSNIHAQKINQTKKLNVNCPICKKDFRTLSMLCDHFNDIHVEKEKGSKCYDDNFQTWLDMFKQDHERLMESDDSSSDTE